MKCSNAIPGLAASQTDTPRAAYSFRWRALISVIVALSFAFLVVSGICLWVAPPGRIANWTNWTILGLRKAEWANLHLWFGLIFVIASGFHLALNWRPMLGYFRSRLTRQLGFRREWLAALVLCVVVFAGTRTQTPPFSSLLAFTGRIRESWERQTQRPPIPHAELLTLAELAEQAEVSLTNALARLAARGIRGVSPDMRVADAAERSRISAQKLYEIIRPQPVPRGQRSDQGKGRGGGAGSGFGRWTLAAFCEQEGIEVQTAQRRLEAQGIKATADLTLREIATRGGYDQPGAILEIIRDNRTLQNP